MPSRSYPMVGSVTGSSGGAIAASTIDGSNLVSNINLPGNNAQANGYGLLGCIGSSSGFGFAYGAVTSGGGFSSGAGYSVVQNGDGSYTVTFSSAFSGVPGVSVIPVNPAAVAAAEFSSITGSAFIVFIRNASNVVVNSSFSFLAIGPR